MKPKLKLLRGGQYDAPPPFRPPLSVFMKCTTADIPQRELRVVEPSDKKVKTS